MRLIEVLLIGGSGLALWPGGRRWSGGGPLLASVLLTLLLLHGIVEGFRWQMAFVYAVASLLSVRHGLRAIQPSVRLRMPGWLRALMTGLFLVLIALSAILACAFPVFTLSAPTGRCAVGVRYLHLTDERRADPFLSDGKRKRGLMVKVYYPAQPDNARPHDHYFGGSRPLLRAYAAFYQMPTFLLDHLALIRTHTKEGLPVSTERANYPVVLFSHGAGASMEVETSQCEDLASHGYIVAAIDHTFVSAATAFPDRIVTAREATTDFHTPEPAGPITQIMADDAAFVLDQLRGLNDAKSASPFAGKLDLDTVGVIGHSVGGAAAYNLALRDRRIKAAINLDGVVYVTPKNPPRIAPFLMLANDRYHVQALQKRESLLQKIGAKPEAEQEMRMMYGSRENYEKARAKAEENVRGLVGVLKTSGELFTIEGSDHMKFTDIGLFIGIPALRELLQIGGKTEPARCLTITEAVTVAFFDQHLKGKSPDTMNALPRRYPELRRVSLQ